MDQGELSLKKERSRKRQRGVALIMVFSVTFLVLGLIAALYWTSVGRHTLMRKRARHTETLYLVEAGMHHAIARLRIGDINPTEGESYCLDIPTATIGPSSVPPTCTEVCAAGEVRVCVGDNASGRNQIDVTANF